MKKLKKTDVKEIIDAAEDDAQILSREVDFSKVLSTGSTLLDLAISGTVIRGGGIPGGIVVEVFGPHSTGKTAILAEVAGSAQNNGGDVMFGDPEARLNKQYAKIYGVEIDDDNYKRPDTVVEMFEDLWGWKPESEDGAICVVCEDSLAALSTDMEMDDEDKMGMKRAKDFSAGLRKTCRIIAANNWLVMCSNQEREGTGGTFTPGGKGIPYYSSLRIRLTLDFPKNKLVSKKKVGKNKKVIEHQYGIITKCKVQKSTIDVPGREAVIYIVFGYGIDDIRGNLQWLKDVTGTTKYNCINDEYSTINKAIEYIEDNELQEDLREAVIDEWERIQKLFEFKRKPKVRF